MNPMEIVPATPQPPAVITPEQRKEFLDAFLETGSARAAAGQTGIAFHLWKELKSRDSEFAAEYQNVHQLVLGEAERAAWLVGVKGIERPVIAKGGKIVGVSVERDTKMLLRILARLDKSWAEHQSIDVNQKTMSIGVNIHPDAMKDLSPEESAFLERMLSITVERQKKEQGSPSADAD